MTRLAALAACARAARMLRDRDGWVYCPADVAGRVLNRMVYPQSRETVSTVYRAAEDVLAHARAADQVGALERLRPRHSTPRRSFLAAQAFLSDITRSVA
jgi:hypothetical protein